MKWQEPSEAWWLLLSLCLCFLPCILAGRILNLSNCSLWCLDIFSKCFFPFLLVLTIYICMFPPFTLHNLQIDTSHSTLRTQKRTKTSLEESGNRTITISHDVPPASVTDGSLHPFCITCISEGSLHQIWILASQCPTEDKPQTFHGRITADPNKRYQPIARFAVIFLSQWKSSNDKESILFFLEEPARCANVSVCYW